MFLIIVKIKLMIRLVMAITAIIDLRKICSKNMKRYVGKQLCPFPFGAVYFLLEQNLRGWTSIISGGVQVKRGLSDSCSFS